MRANQVRNYLAKIGRKGGKSGSKADKVRAARIRWKRQKSPTVSR